MDRRLFWPGALIYETDHLGQARFSLEGLGWLIQAVLGTATVVDGLAVGPSGPPALTVQVSPGAIYAQANLDSTPYSSLPLDTTHQVMKQGLLRDAATLACAAPVTSGQSISYLIQAAFQETDGQPVILDYFNAANPSVPWEGAMNSGNPDNTVRQDQCVVTAKAGTPAATGSQTTPAPDAGKIGLAVVTVAQGQTTITASSIAVYSARAGVSALAKAVMTGAIDTGGITGRRNRLINGDFRIDQRVASTLSNGAMGADRWFGLQQTASVGRAQQATQENGQGSNDRLTQSQATPQRFGYGQIVESKDCIDLRGRACTLSGRIRASAAQVIRYAILEWDSTADGMTRAGMVNDWTSTTYTAGNFLAANWAVVAMGSLTPAAATWTQLPAITGTPTSSANNLAVLVWTEAVAAQNFTLDVGVIQFEAGAVASPFEIIAFASALDACERFYEKSFPLATAPAQAAGGTGCFQTGQVAANNTSQSAGYVGYVARKRATGTVTLFNTTSSNAQMRDVSTSQDWTLTAVNNAGTHGFGLGGTSPASSAAGDGIQINWTCDAELG